jgi:hypothetical protein
MFTVYVSQLCLPAMLDQEKKSLQFACILVVALLSFLIAFDFLMKMEILHSRFTSIHALDKAFFDFLINAPHKLKYIRFALVLGMVTLSYLQKKSLTRKNRISRIIYILLMLFSIAGFMAGYTPYYYYNLVVYPALFLSMFILIPIGFQSFQDIVISSSSVLSKVNKTSEDFSFSYSTTRGTLQIPDIRTATFIEGSAKAGKTASIIIPTIIQAVKKKFAGLIYDYEGNLKEEGGALLTRVAYTAIKRSGSPVRLAVINFSDLSRTMRCNPLSAKYIKSYSHALELATVIMYNINRTWSRHKDFWAENAIAAYAATIWFFQKTYPGFCTIPHVTEFLLNDFTKVLKILNTDEDVAPYIRPILAALQRDASGQIAGAESSTQFPLARMRSPQVYYVFNPEPDKEFDLDITSLLHPVLLCVCNTPEIQNALAPSIGAIIQVCKVQMNKLSKHKSIFLFDEMPTIYIDNADKIPAEARKKQVSSFFAVQTFDQLIRDYGLQNAKVLRNSCGNIFTGITSFESAEMISKMMGEYKQSDYAQTTSDSGQSVTHSMKNEKVLMASKVTSQPTGHFSGRLLGGNPPYFSVQFKHSSCPVEKIPHFNYPIDVDDLDLQEEVLSVLVEENYQRIKDDVKTLVSTYNYLFK